MRGMRLPTAGGERRRFAWPAASGIALAVMGAILAWATRAPAQNPTCPPAPGTQIRQDSPSKAELLVELPGFNNTTTTLALAGNVVTIATAQQDGSLATVILSMDLVGTDPLLGTVSLVQSPRSLPRGVLRRVRLTEQPDGTPECTAADSFFDVWVEISFKGGEIVLPTVHNEIPLHLVGEGLVPIQHDRPFAFVQPAGNPTPFVDPNGRVVALVSKTRHDIVPKPPESCFPPAGVDIMDSVLLHDLDVPGIGLCRANLRGPVRVQRSDPHVDPATGLQTIDTEIVSLSLTGVDPVCGKIQATLNPCRRSTGKIVEQVRGTCFPADSFFDVFVKVDLPDLGMCLYACQAARMKCVIARIPPFGCLYNLNIGTSGVVPLYRGPCLDVCDPGLDPCAQNPLPPPDAFIIKAVHQPIPPPVCDCFPRAGEDVLLTTLGHSIDIPGFNINCNAFSGPIVVRRSDPYLNAAGVCCLDTEIIHMDMVGTCADGSVARIRLNPDRPSKGTICAQTPAACYPALSCFDIFFEIEVITPTAGPVLFRNCDPATMCCQIDALPPLGCPYQLRNAPIELFRHIPGTLGPCLHQPRPAPDGVLANANHVPEAEVPPCCPEYGPGEDVFQSTLLHDIDIPGIGLCNANLRGPVKIRRGQPYRDPETNRCAVQVEMVDLLLQGSDPVCGRIIVKLDPRRPSRGRIQELEPNTCFPAESCFEMNVRIELPDIPLVLVPCEPAKMCCTIDALPPIGCLYNLNIGAGDNVPLYEEQATADVCSMFPRLNPRALIVKAVHRPEPPCPSYPPAGDDIMDSELSHRIRLFGLGAGGTDLIADADLSGPVVVRREDPEVDPVTGKCTIPTEIVDMNLAGNDPIAGPVDVHIDPDQRSVGAITEIDPDTGFVADSFFDVFVEIDIPEQGLVLRNCAPARLQSTIEAIPPFNVFYRLDLSAVPLYRAGACPSLPSAQISPVAVIEAARHVPRQPTDICPEYGPGIDVMNSVLRHDIEIFGVGGKVCTAPLRGKVTVERGAPYLGTNAAGEEVPAVSTRIIGLDLIGTDPDCGPMRITLRPDQASRGTISAINPGSCFPAESCFDMWVEVHVLDMVLRTCKPVTMCCEISSLPPFGCTYRLDLGSTVNLFLAGDCNDPIAAPAGQIRAAQHRPEPCAPLSATCVLGADGKTIDVSWVSDPDCPCDQVRVTRTAPDGTTTEIPVPAGATSISDTPPCPPALLGQTVLWTYCVECIAAGVASEPACCELNYTCPGPCPPLGVDCKLDPAANEVVVTWQRDPDCPCDEVVVTRVNPDGSETPIPLPAVGATTIVDVPPCPPDRLGQSILYTYCVQCRAGDLLSDRVCCELNYPCPKPCEIESVVCDPAGGEIVIVWTTSLPNCCQEYIITLDGAEVKRVPGSETSTTVPCRPGRYCVQCVLPDGTVGPIVPEKQCCEVPPEACPCSDADSEVTGLTCVSDPATGIATLSWDVTNPDCCGEFVITRDGQEVTRVPSTQFTFSIDCVPGNYCVQCVRSDGTLGPAACCDVTCIRPCGFIDAETHCEVTPDGIRIQWIYADPDCICEKLEIRDGKGNVLLSVPAGATEAMVPGDCREILGGEAGTICVVCLDATGAAVARSCCQVDCPSEPHLQRPCDCNQDGKLDLSDAICLLRHLFLGEPRQLACGSGDKEDPATKRLVDCNGDGGVDISDAIYILTYLFLGGPPPALGIDCVDIPGCPNVCVP